MCICLRLNNVSNNVSSHLFGPDQGQFPWYPVKNNTQYAPGHGQHMAVNLCVYHLCQHTTEREREWECERLRERHLCITLFYENIAEHLWIDCSCNDGWVIVIVVVVIVVVVVLYIYIVLYVCIHVVLASLPLQSLSSSPSLPLL